jgi:hypothetical protein
VLEIIYLSKETLNGLLAAQAHCSFGDHLSSCPDLINSVA